MSIYKSIFLALASCSWTKWQFFFSQFTVAFIEQHESLDEGVGVGWGEGEGEGFIHVSGIRSTRFPFGCDMCSGKNATSWSKSSVRAMWWVLVSASMVSVKESYLSTKPLCYKWLTIIMYMKKNHASRLWSFKDFFLRFNELKINFIYIWSVIKISKY